MTFIQIGSIPVATDPSVGDPTRFRERRYLLDILETAIRQPVWPSHIRSVVILSAHRRHHHWPAIQAVPPPRLVLAIGNEDATVRPVLLDAAEVLVQHYIRSDPTRTAPVLELPLGPGGPEPCASITPWNERDIDVFFVGHIHHKRWKLARELGALPSLAQSWPTPLLVPLRHLLLQRGRLPGRSSLIQFTTAFGAGLPRTEYLDRMSRSRIALVPGGFKQPHTFRHFEAARAGCVLVGTPLPNRRFPVLEAPLGQPLVQFLESLLNAPQRLHDQHRQVVSAWRENGSPEAVGRQLAQDLRALSTSADRPGSG